MALLTDDCDMNENKLQTLFGGNGDYYITIWWVDEKGFNQSKTVRIAMSGGNAPSEVKIAASKLHWAMEDAGLNEYPD